MLRMRLPRTPTQAPIDGRDGDLGSEAGLAGHDLDLDHPLGHLRHLRLEQAADEVGVAPRKHDLDLVADVPHVEDQAPHPITGMKLLAGNLLGARHEALGPVDLDHERPALVPVRRAGDDLALPLGELLQQAVPLVLAELLDHHLLGGLGRDPAEAHQRDVLPAAVLLVPPDGDRAAGAVDVTPELLRVERVEVLARGTDHRLLEVLDEQVAIDTPVAGDGVEDAKGFRVHQSCRSRLLSCRGGEGEVPKFRQKDKATSVSRETPVTGGNHRRSRRGRGAGLSRAVSSRLPPHQAQRPRAAAPQACHGRDQRPWPHVGSTATGITGILRNKCHLLPKGTAGQGIGYRRSNHRVNTSGRRPPAGPADRV
jgi:hypothetical protein